LVSDPCSIETAINDASSATSDDVTLLGGLPPTPYTTTTALVVPSNVTVHGLVGARPVIQSSLGGSAPGIQLGAGSILRDVVVDASGPNEAAIEIVGGGIVERVIGRTTGGSSPGGCQALDGGAPVIRDSVCWHDGPTTPNPVGGVTARNGSATAQTLTLRNVTAISSDANNEAGIFAIQSGGGALTVNATNTIAFSENGSDVAHLAGFTPTAINLDHSNYDSESDAGNVITNPGTGSPNFNQITAPLFVDRLGGDFDQLPTSAGTIDLGTATGVLPDELDLDGHERLIGAAPDIGADELRRPTSTSITCTPPSLIVGSGSTTCTATVTDTSSSPTNPTGDVSFTSNGAGTFSNGGSCTLVGNAGAPGCQVIYTPTVAGSGSHQITAAYPGDSEHELSQGSTAVGVLRHPTSTAIACTPTSLTLGVGATTCTATVTDTGSSPTNPTGSVNFTSTGTGTFSGGGACSLLGNAGQPGCQVTYTPTVAGSGSHQITAAYLGDAEHAVSQGSTQVSVLAPAGTVPVAPRDRLATAIRKCKKKFPKGPKRKKCIKRAKKRAPA
jgi:hypothetical protein